MMIHPELLPQFVNCQLINPQREICRLLKGLLYVNARPLPAVVGRVILYIDYVPPGESHCSLRAGTP